MESSFSGAGDVAIDGIEAVDALADVVAEVVGEAADGFSGSLADVLSDVVADAAGAAATAVAEAVQSGGPIPGGVVADAAEAAMGVAVGPAYAPIPVDIHVPESQEACVAARAVVTHVDVAAAVRILDEVMDPFSPGHFYPPSLLRNILASGAPLFLAEDAAGEPVGVLVSMLGWQVDGPSLQSGPMAVLPHARGMGAAKALKAAQAAWCEERGIADVRWSFDMMNKALVRLNLHTLGAVVVELLPGYDGPRHPGEASELPHHRLLVRSRMPVDGVVPPQRGRRRPVVAVSGAPRNRRWRLSIDPAWRTADVVVIELPDDIAALREREPLVAAEWQSQVSAVLREALGAGWHLDADVQGRYRLRPPSTVGRPAGITGLTVVG